MIARHIDGYWQGCRWDRSRRRQQPSVPGAQWYERAKSGPDSSGPKGCLPLEFLLLPGPLQMPSHLLQITSTLSTPGFRKLKKVCELGQPVLHSETVLRKKKEVTFSGVFPDTSRQSGECWPFFVSQLPSLWEPRACWKGLCSVQTYNLNSSTNEW